MSLHSYDDSAGSGTSRSVFWNAIGLVGRQGLILLFSLILARMLGPESFGIVAQATVYFTLLTMILDQGLTASLISKRSVNSAELGAAAMLNLVLAATLCGGTFVFARGIAELFRTEELRAVLDVMAVGLFLKAIAIVPRTILMRRFQFKAIAIAEASSALIAGVAAVIAAAMGAGYWSIVVQLIGMDIVASSILYLAARPPWPNFRWRELRGHFKFGLQVFGSNLLSFSSRNADNILVGRYLGPIDLGQYSLAYRVLLTPIQMISIVVTRVLFPAVSRARTTPTTVQALLVKSTSGISILAFPLMGLLAVSAHDSVDVVLGEAWLPAAPIIAVLALTGARQSVTAANAPVVLGMGRADIQLRFSAVAAIVQVGGIFAGLPWGALGVAWGYTIAGLALTPAILAIQKQLTGLGYRRQLGGMVPALHSTVWAVVAYLGIGLVTDSTLGDLAAGVLLGSLTYLIVFWIFHKSTFLTTVSWFREILGMAS